MYPEVQWPVRREHPTLFVLTSALALTNEKQFVVRVRDGEAEWIDVQPSLTSGNLIEVFGDLREGDLVVLRGTDELRPGTTVNAHLVQINAR
jgi:hypothetical protein